MDTTYEPPLALTIIGTIFIGLALCVSIWIMGDILWRRGWESMMAIMIPVYVLNALYLAPITLWTYLVWGRPTKPVKEKNKAEVKSVGMEADAEKGGIHDHAAMGHVTHEMHQDGHDTHGQHHDHDMTQHERHEKMAHEGHHRNEHAEHQMNGRDMHMMTPEEHAKMGHDMSKHEGYDMSGHAHQGDAGHEGHNMKHDDHANHAGHEMSMHEGHNMGAHAGHHMAGHSGHDMSKHAGHDMSGHAGHFAHMMDDRPMFATITIAVCHCGAGCLLGDIVGEWLVWGVGAQINGRSIWVEWLVDYGFALLFGIIFQYWSIAPMSGAYGPKTLWRAAKADFLSLTFFEVGLFGWMAIFQLAIWEDRLGMDNVVYWWMMQVGMFLGHWTAFPINWWLIKNGIKEPCA